MEMPDFKRPKQHTDHWSNELVHITVAMDQRLSWMLRCMAASPLHSDGGEPLEREEMIHRLIEEGAMRFAFDKQRLMDACIDDTQRFYHELLIQQFDDYFQNNSHDCSDAID